MAIRILLVDDEPLMIKGLKRTLEQDGYETDSASDGEEALKKLNSEHYDLVLLDVMLPKLSGIEVCQIAGISAAVVRSDSLESLECSAVAVEGLVKLLVSKIVLSFGKGCACFILAWTCYICVVCEVAANDNDYC